MEIEDIGLMNVLIQEKKGNKYFILYYYIFIYIGIIMIKKIEEIVIGIRIIITNIALIQKTGIEIEKEVEIKIEKKIGIKIKKRTDIKIIIKKKKQIIKIKRKMRKKIII